MTTTPPTVAVPLGEVSTEPVEPLLVVEHVLVGEQNAHPRDTVRLCDRDDELTTLDRVVGVARGLRRNPNGRTRNGRAASLRTTHRTRDHGHEDPDEQERGKNAGERDRDVATALTGTLPPRDHLVVPGRHYAVVVEVRSGLTALAESIAHESSDGARLTISCLSERRFPKTTRPKTTIFLSKCQYILTFGMKRCIFPLFLL